MAEGLHLCPYCPAAYRKAPALRQHVSRDHPKEVAKAKASGDFKCHCGAGFNQKCHLTRHQATCMVL